MKRAIIGLVVLAAMLLGGCWCEGGPTKQERIDAFLDAGWMYVEQGNFSAALAEFSDALKLDDTNVSGNVGKGWSLLLLGNEDLLTITTALEAGTTEADWQNHSWCGLAVTRLNELRYTQADTLAGLVLSTDSSYVFTYRPQIDWRDLLLIQAEARYLTSAYQQAWQALQALIDGPPYDSIDPNDANTWFIGARQYSLFEQLLAVVISDLAEQYRQM